MLRTLYSCVYYLVLPAMLLRLLWRSGRQPGYRRRWRERFGCSTLPELQQAVWLHAVSVGELQAAGGLIEALLQQQPSQSVIVTTMTPSASDLLIKRYGGRVCHVYVPFDTPGAVNRFLRAVKPRLLLLMETELWPNLLHHTAARGCSIILVNARLSKSSARGYARLPGLTRPMLQTLSAVAAQTRNDARRLQCLGVPPDRVSVCGNLKYELEPGSKLRAHTASLAQRWLTGRAPVIVAGSTHPAEESLLLEVFGRLKGRHPSLVLVLAPRHPERAPALERLARSAGFHVACQSSPASAAGLDILVGDSLGDLMALYGLGPIAFVGGSLIARGGHNLLEPASWGCAVVSGPHLANFFEPAALLRRAGALELAEDVDDLEASLDRLLRDAERVQMMGEAGRSVVADHRGALQKTVELLGRVG